MVKTQEGMAMLLLSEPEMIEAGVMDMKKCVDVIDESFALVGKGDYVMGGPSTDEHGVMLYFPKESKFPNMPVFGPDRRFMAMITYLGGRFNVAGVKWYGSNVENRNRGLPRSIHLIVLNDPDTAEPLVMMSGNLISAMRTGAAVGVGARYICPDAKVLGLIGSRVIGKASLMAFAAVLDNLEEVKVFDLDVNAAEEFSETMAAELGVTVRAVDSFEEAVENSDILNIATSGPAKVVIEQGMLKEGALLSLPSRAIVHDDVLADAQLVLDHYPMHIQNFRNNEELPDDSPYKSGGVGATRVIEMIKAGSLNEEEIINLTSLAAGLQEADTSGKRNTILFTGGLGVQDFSWAHTIYMAAKNMGLGSSFSIWDEAEWH